MIERLIHALQALAAPSDAQLTRFPGFVANAEELALDFDDALRLVYDCPQIELAPRQRECLGCVSTYLETRSGHAAASFWTEEAVRSSADWEDLRRLAANALTSLGATLELPPPSSAIYSRGRAK